MAYLIMHILFISFNKNPSIYVDFIFYLTLLLNKILFTSNHVKGYFLYSSRKKRTSKKPHTYYM